MRGAPLEGEKILENLNVVIALLQDLFILEGVKAGIKKEEVRRILRIDKHRVTRISKHISKP